MLFNSSAFLVFLIVVFILFWKAASVSNRLTNWVLLVSSYVFYGWWDWRFLILIVISSASDFIIGRLIFNTEQQQKRKLFLGLSLAINLGILFFFKYFGFFIDSLRSLTGTDVSATGWDSLNIILPVGISFYTFQTLSYTIDIYRQKIEPTRSVLTFFTFVAFFPQLVAGPIERAARLIPQFENPLRFSYPQASSGLKMMLWGFFKKMVIADQLAFLVDAVYGSPEKFGGAAIILATFLFGFQIYCDFSGYSDIAIGTARLFGIELMINFRTPYFATSFRHYWHRWHISLSTWFRDYVYIPLGGSKSGSVRTAQNILTTFVASGLWHGANVTFLIWGFIHGTVYIIEQSVSPLIRLPRSLKNGIGWFITFAIVNFSWLFFRAESASRAFFMLKKMTSDFQNLTAFKYLLVSNGSLTEPAKMLVFAFPVFLVTEFFIGKRTFDSVLHPIPVAVRWGFYYLIVLMILFLGVLKSAPQFIYFQF